MALYDETFFGNANGNENGPNDPSVLKNSYRIVFLGAPKVGKTSIVNWFLGREYRDHYIPTIEDFHRKIYKIRGDIYRLDILDTSGNDPFPAMKKLNIMIGDLFVLCFSIDDIDSYIQVKSLCDQVIELKKQHKSSTANTSSISTTAPSILTSTHQHNHHKHNSKLTVPILMIGNKLDLLLENKIPNRCVEVQEIEKFTSTLKTCLYYETSCKNLIGLDRAFEKFFYQTNLPVEICPAKHRRVSLNLDLTKPQFSKVQPKSSRNSKHHKQQQQQQQLDNNDEASADGPTNTGSTSGSYSNKKSLKRQKSKKQIQNDESSTGFYNSTSSLSVDGQSTATQNKDQQQSNSNNGHNGSFKRMARRSIRKMTFKRQFTDACGAVWLNARRPSIRAELNLLNVKNKTNFHLPTKNKSTNIDNSNSNKNNGSSGHGNNNKTFKFLSFLKFFNCTSKHNYDNDIVV